ncbi:MAG: hypothetical protein R3E58_12990 [Phycisphaerae bacterium]
MTVTAHDNVAKLHIDRIRLAKQKMLEKNDAWMREHDPGSSIRATSIVGVLNVSPN